MFGWPGWNSLDAVERIHSLSEVAGIVLLGLLVVAEAITFKYGGRKDTLITLQQEEEKRANDHEIARLHNEAAQAQQKAGEAVERAAVLGVTVDNLTQFAKTKSEEADIAIASLNAATEKATQKISAIQSHQAQRHLSREQKQKIVSALSSYRGTPIGVVSVANDPETATYRDDFVEVLNAAGWNISGITDAISVPPRIGITFGLPQGQGQDTVLEAEGVTKFIETLEALHLVDPHYVRLTDASLKVPQANIQIGSKKPLEGETNTKK